MTAVWLLTLLPPILLGGTAGVLLGHLILVFRRRRHGALYQQESERKL
jgi:hypothetical protein